MNESAKVPIGTKYTNEHCMNGTDSLSIKYLFHKTK